MEKFKEKIRNRNKKATLAVSMISIVYIYLSGTTNTLVAMNDFISGYNLGVFIALQISFIYFITKNNQALKNEKQLKTLYIKENDERTKLIQYKSSMLGISIFIFALLLATTISGFYNSIVFYTLLGVCSVILSILMFVKLYLIKKI